jgi:magnesium transporter
VVGWNLVGPLPEEIGSFAGDLRVKVAKGQIARMPTADVARILEQLRGEQQIAIFDWLKPDVASDALEQLDPKVQREAIARRAR